MILETIKHVSSFGLIAQWLQHVHGKHEVEVVGLNPTWANFLYEIEKTFAQNEYYVYIYILVYIYFGVYILVRIRNSLF